MPLCSGHWLIVQRPQSCQTVKTGTSRAETRQVKLKRCWDKIITSLRWHHLRLSLTLFFLLFQISRVWSRNAHSPSVLFPSGSPLAGLHFLFNRYSEMFVVMKSGKANFLHKYIVFNIGLLQAILIYTTVLSLVGFTLCLLPPEPPTPTFSMRRITKLFLRLR